jgi:phosphatidylglycerophosphate synthase
VFAPLLRVLAWAGVSPDLVTLLSLAAGMSFASLYFWSKPAALAALGLHVLLDGLDGPLARHLGVASRRGSFTDTSADQVVVATTMLALMAEGTVGVVAGGSYLFLYTVVVAFAMVRNALRVPYSWLVRPRFFLYAWLVVETYVLPGTIDYVLWLFNAVLALKMVSGFLRIRNRLGR